MTFDDIRNFDLNSVDWNNMGQWPMPVKTVVVAALCIVILVGGYFGLTKEQLLTLEKKQLEEESLKQVFQLKYNQAVNLAAYRQQLEEIKLSFGALVRQLPDKTEVAELLVDITQAGLAHGLEFELFQPEQEKPEEFYAELPIQIRVRGNYHALSEFVSDLAQLHRIVTIHSISIGGDDDNLVMECTAKTYRYLSEDTDQ